SMRPCAATVPGRSCSPYSGEYRMTRLHTGRGRWTAGVLSLTAALALGLPARSFAQAVTPATLAGGWAKKGQTQVYLTFKTDSTLAIPVLSARWHLAGDTLVIDTILRTTQKVDKEDLRRVVTLKGK